MTSSWADAASLRNLTSVVSAASEDINNSANSWLGQHKYGSSVQPILMFVSEDFKVVVMQVFENRPRDFRSVDDLCLPLCH